jgi:hypothetical protein
MKISENIPPRRYECGFDVKRWISDCAKIDLAQDEQVTFVTPGGAEYDVTRKDFGFYATPSTNSRLAKHGLRAVLARNRMNHFFVLLVEAGREPLFEKYLAEEKMTLVTWMDDTDRLLSFCKQT